jgi:endonuclease YncB( thermonuclease family)
VEANSEQVRRGMAWVYVKYAAKGSPLYGLQREAQGIRRGLWADPQPVAPWEWRSSQRAAPLGKTW